jgi:hypothetical protein
MKTMINTLAVLIVLGMATISEARTVRATEMTPALWSKLEAGASSGDPMIVEFRQGDQLPVNIAAKGDLIETAQSGSTTVQIKRNFWLRLQNNDVDMSLDGVTYKPFKEVVGGSISADADANQSGGPANVINVVFGAYLK